MKLFFKITLAYRLIFYSKMITINMNNHLLVEGVFVQFCLCGQNMFTQSLKGK